MPSAGAVFVFNKLQSEVEHRSEALLGGRYIQNFIWLVVGRLFRMALSLVVGAWVARYLAPAEFGRLSYQLSIVALLSALAGAGLDGLIVRELVSRRADPGETLGTALGLRMACGVGLYVALVAGWWFWNGGGVGFYMVALLGGDVVLQSGNVFDLYFQARLANKWAVLASIVSSVVSSAVRVTLIVAGASVIYFAAAVLLEGLVLAGGLAGFYLWSGAGRERWSFSGRRALRLLSESWPMIVSAVAVAGCMRIDQVMLKALAGEASVGIYAAASRLGEAWYFLPMFMATVLNPWILEGRAQGEAVYRHRLLRLYAGILWLSIGVAALLSLFASPLITMLYGADYTGAIGPLRIHAWGGVFLALGVAGGKWYLAEGHTLGLMNKALFGLLLNLAANAVWIPAYGLGGAAAATACGHFAANVLYDLLDPRVRPQLRLKLRAFAPWSFGKP